MRAISSTWDDTPLADASDIRRVFKIGSDVELANATIADFRQAHAGAPLTHARGDFYFYEAATGVWCTIDRNELERIVHTYDGALVGDRATLKVKQSTVLGSIARAAAILATPTFFDDAPTGIACRNGFLRVDESGAHLLPHSPDFRATVGAPFNYNATAPRAQFEKFLDDAFRDDKDAADKKALLQEHAGAALIGVATKYESALVLVGSGANGKSRYLVLLVAPFPQESVTAIAPQTWGQEYRRALLSRSRLNVVSELPEADIIESEAFKAIISGDSIDARFIRDQPFTYRPRAAHVFAANRLPGTKDQTPAFWRRILPVTFNRTFLPHEQDPAIAERIVAAETEGVFAWAIEGAVRLLHQGRYTLPPSVVEAREAWKRDADPVRRFADERVRASTSVKVTGSLLYETYRRWTAANGHHPLASNKFAERMRELGFEGKHASRGNLWSVEIVDDEASHE